MSLQDNVRWIRMMLHSDSDAATNYDLWGAPQHLRTADNMPTVNMGYWKDVSGDDPDGLRRATEGLFRLVGEAAELGPGDQAVLDVGCGFGTNALFAIRTFGPQKVTGLNVSSFQLEWCQRLAEEARLGDRVAFHQGSATALPFADASFDKVVSIEAAFHFQARRDFFREALRVLRPGGLLALADIIVVPPRHAPDRLNLRLLRRSLQIPADNVYGVDHYLGELHQAGFTIEAADSIREHVIPPYTKWAGRHPLHNLSQISLAQFVSTATFHAYPWDYYVFKARKG